MRNKRSPNSCVTRIALCAAFVVVMILFANEANAQTELLFEQDNTKDTKLIVDAIWKFTQADSIAWLPAEVPGCVHKDLIRNGRIKDPFLSTNERDCQWVENKDWMYQTESFDVPDDLIKSDAVSLLFNGLDTYASVYLNDQLILTSDNAFRTYEVDVRKLLKRKNNVLRLLFQSPIRVAPAKIKQLPYPLPGAAERAVTRKPQFHYGWDWGPRLVTSGITGTIELHAWNHARLKDIYVRQNSVSEEKADLTALFEVESVTEDPCSLFFQISPQGDFWSTAITLKKGVNKVELPITIPWPKRWWCNDMGNQNLYTFDCYLSKGRKLLDQKQIRTGIRSLELQTEKDSIGENFQFVLNGFPVFVKGANYIPIAYFPASAKEEDYRMLLFKCKEAHFNMLRVWGGGVYEKDLFYRLCDEYGIMVWQDFMFACSMYPADSNLIKTVIPEAEEQTIRLRNHPCIALWCGNNENAEGWEKWGWQQGLTGDQKFRTWRAYKDLFDLTLKPIVKRNTNTPYWESSPLYGRSDKRSLTEGDSHYWGVWHDAEPFEVLKEKIPRFMSEFGFQSFPSNEVLKQMISGSGLNLNDQGILQHQKHPRGFQLMDEYMKRWYPGVSTDSMETYRMLSQVVQAEGICMGIEAHRRNRQVCGGTMYWQLNDVWPSFSWSSIDYKGNDKLLFSMLRKIYEPQLISPVIENDRLKIYWISDNYIKEDTLLMRYAVYNGDGVTIFERDLLRAPLLQGSTIIFDEKLKDAIGSSNPFDKFIRIEIYQPGNKLPRYERSAKLMMESASWLTTGPTISRHYDDKVNRKRISLRDNNIINMKSGKVLNK